MAKVKAILAVAAKTVTTKEYLVGLVTGFICGTLHHYFGL